MNNLFFWFSVMKRVLLYSLISTVFFSFVHFCLLVLSNQKIDYLWDNYFSHPNIIELLIYLTVINILFCLKNVKNSFFLLLMQNLKFFTSSILIVLFLHFIVKIHTLNLFNLIKIQ